MADGTQKIILNTKGYQGQVSDEIKDFLEYVENSTREIAAKSRGTLVKNIQKKVDQVKRNKGLEVEYMTFEEKLREEKRESWEEGREEGIIKGRQEGIAEGRQEGIAEGETCFALLTEKLLKESRVEDLRRAANDRSFRQSLYTEFGIKE